jgi:uncharacterized membrane protein YGL010W
MSQPITQNRDDMSFAMLLAWAWSETPPVHRNRTNLLIHLFAVPLFVLGNLLVISAIVLGWRFLAVGLICAILAFAIQGIGHSLELQRPPPFISLRDFLGRLYAEQLCNFWRFLFSGKWYAALRAK